MGSSSMHKSFQDYINEGREAPLYHATESLVLVDILQTNLLRPLSEHDSKKLLHYNSKRGKTSPYYSSDTIIQGISTTRSLNLAKTWRTPYNAIIQLNQRKLSYNYRIVPIQYWSDALDSARPQNNDKQNEFSMVRNEYEEFILTNKPIKISDYIDKILVNTRTHLSTMNSLEKLAKMFNKPLELF
jgi:hypothetical protein